MLVIIGMIVASSLAVWFIHHELRSACEGVTLSNGMDVMVTPEMYEEIVREYHALHGLDLVGGWDQAVLNVLRAERPQEWKYLTRSLRQADDATAANSRPVRAKRRVHA